MEAPARVTSAIVSSSCLTLRKGYVAISPQYRFCPKETFPAQVEDVKAAVRWVKSHAKEYNIDPERLGAVGFSAGGISRSCWG